jgi:hypothetical protein
LLHPFLNLPPLPSRFNKKILTHRSDEFHWQFPKKFVIFVVSGAKPINIVIFAFTYVLEGFSLFYSYFCMDLFSIDSNEKMKQ